MFKTNTRNCNKHYYNSLQDGNELHWFHAENMEWLHWSIDKGVTVNTGTTTAALFDTDCTCTATSDILRPRLWLLLNDEMRSFYANPRIDIFLSEKVKDECSVYLSICSMSVCLPICLVSMYLINASAIGYTDVRLPTFAWCIIYICHS